MNGKIAAAAVVIVTTVSTPIHNFPYSQKLKVEIVSIKSMNKSVYL